MFPLTISGPAKKLGGLQQQNLIAALCDLGMFGVVEANTETANTAATTRILSILSIFPPPILGMYGVEENTVTAKLTVILDGWGSQKASPQQLKRKRDIFISSEFSVL